MMARASLPFDRQCALSGLPVPVAEHRFHATRRWRIDWAWPPQRIALEVEGGVWTSGRHTRGKGAVGDMEKYNTLAVMGWRLLRVTPQDVASGRALTWAREALRSIEGLQ